MKNLIHRAGYKILTTFFLTGLVAICTVFWFYQANIVFWGLSAIYVGLLTFMARFFRIPKRQPQVVENIVTSAADGLVVAIEETEEKEYLKQNCIQVSVFMSVWNVHINWFPVSGKLKKFIYHPGKYLLARNPKSSELNERTTTIITLQDGRDIVVRQIAGIVARRIESYLSSNGSDVHQGEELGFIKFGSRVDIFLPLNSEILVKVGDKVKGRISNIAKLT